MTDTALRDRDRADQRLGPRRQGHGDRSGSAGEAHQGAVFALGVCGWAQVAAREL